MKKTKRRMCFAIVLTLCNLAFIWGNSLLPGTVSGRISDWVGRIICAIFAIPAGSTAGGGLLLRKLGHFTEFAALGILLTWISGMRGEKGAYAALLPLLGAMACACVDETIQLFAAGRASSLIDVWIDTCGAAAGVMLLLLAFQLTRKRHHKILEEKT